MDGWKQFHFFSLVVINDFNAFRIVPGPDETDTVLIIDPDAVLPLAVSLEVFQVVTRALEIAQFPGGIEHA
jgi:hypothetical protein